MAPARVKLDSSWAGLVSDNGGTVGCVDSYVLDELLHIYKRYQLRSKVEIDNVAEFYCCQHFAPLIDSCLADLVATTTVGDWILAGYGEVGTGDQSTWGGQGDNWYSKDVSLTALLNAAHS